MKIPVVVVSILLVPLFTWLQHRNYQTDLKPKLLEEVKQALRAPELAGLSPEVSENASLDQLDVTLTGEAPTPELREKARVAADAVRGARALESRNKITVPASLTLERTVSGSFAKGLLPDQNHEYLLTGLKSRGFTVKPEDWQSRDFIKGPDWLFKPGFDNWLTGFLATSGARSLVIHNKEIELKGDATADLRTKWIGELNMMLPRETTVTDSFRLFPSVYHFPNYHRSSKIDADAYNRLAAVLSSSEILFDVGSSVLNESELPKVSTIANAIKATSPEVSFVLGGHTDITGDRDTNVRLSRERSQAVAAKLSELEVPSNRLEVVAFGASQAVGSNETEASRQLSRRVEVLVK